MAGCSAQNGESVCFWEPECSIPAGVCELMCRIRWKGMARMNTAWSQHPILYLSQRLVYTI